MGMKYVEDEQKFLEYAWIVYSSYFHNKDSFISAYETISSPETKNKFLGIVSYYLFLVEDVKFSSRNFDEADLSFVQETYQFLSIIALIESLYDKGDFLEFYPYLMKKNPFPIHDRKNASILFEEYNTDYGCRRAVTRFFEALDDRVKARIQKSITYLSNSKYPGSLDEVSASVEDLTKLLYQIRSEYIHSGTLILEFGKGSIISIRNRKPFYCNIELPFLCEVFKSGVLSFFGISPEIFLI
jgi:hypothetical protein